MATVTRETFRQRFLEQCGVWKSYTTTSNGNASGNDLISTQLTGRGDDYFNDYFVLLPDGVDGKQTDLEFRQADDFTSSTGLVSVDGYSAFSGQVVSGVTFQIVPQIFDPDLIHAALNASRRRALPYLYKRIRNEDLIVDDLLSANGFETDSGTSPTFTGWTEVGSPTVTQETTIVMHGSGAAKVVASGADGKLTQAPTVNVNELKGKTLIARAWAYASDASEVRIRLDWDGTSLDSSSYHGGATEWEWLDDLTPTVPETATQVKMTLEVADGYTGYFDKCYLCGPPIYRYSVPTELLEGPFMVEMQDVETLPNGTYSYLMGVNGPVRGRILRLHGKGLLSEVTADTSTMEINDAQGELLIAFAIEYWANALLNDPRTAAGQREYIVSLRDRAIQNRIELLQTRGIVMPDMPRQMSNQWKVENVGGTLYLVLTEYRG